jgi:molybdopterin-binding protein
MSARNLKISEAAALLGVSPDTVRRRASAADLTLEKEPVQTLAAADVARLAAAEAPDIAFPELTTPFSARNRFGGIVTQVLRDGVMAQVDIQAGPFRMVSLISREAADDLGLEPGSLVAATVKATNVGIEALS